MTRSARFATAFLTALFGGGIAVLAGCGAGGGTSGGQGSAPDAGVPAATRAVPDAEDLLAGAFRPRAYRLTDGTSLAVDGRIVFLPDVLPGGAAADRGEWMVLFYVTDAAGEAVRGSAEGGGYFWDDGTLVLTHAFHLAGGGAIGPFSEAPLAMALRSFETAATDHQEPCEVRFDGSGRMTLGFPSGNAMDFERTLAAPAGGAAPGAAGQGSPLR